MLKDSSSLSGGRMLFVLTGLGWGGAESQVIALARRFREMGWQVAVCTLLGSGERRHVLESQRIPVVDLGMRRGRPNPLAIVRLARFVRKFKPDIVHAHMVHAILLARLARMISDMPVLVSSSHNVNEGPRWRSIAYRITDRLTDITTNVSDVAVRRSVERRVAPAHRIRCMPNGIDVVQITSLRCKSAGLREELGIAGRFVWVIVASLTEQKDYPTLLGALELLKKHPSSPIVVAVGDGPCRDSVIAEGKSKGLEEYVRFVGIRDDVVPIMYASDAFVLSSAWEGLPIVLLEAAACGLPIVATDVGGNGQAIVSGRTGVLVPPGDSKALAEAMAYVMDMAVERRIEMGRVGRDHVLANFELDQIVKAWIDIYQYCGYGKA